jgi:hypothetical protein
VCRVSEVLKGGSPTGSLATSTLRVPERPSVWINACSAARIWSHSLIRPCWRIGEIGQHAPLLIIVPNDSVLLGVFGEPDITMGLFNGCCGATGQVEAGLVVVWPGARNVTGVTVVGR